MNRRTFLERGGLALAGFGLSGCATTSSRRSVPATPRRAPINLAPVRASWDRVIRTTVGLRPHRDGGKIVIRRFDTPRDLMSLTEPVIVNCTGLGSFTLFDDKELVPIKGQLTVMVPQPEVHYRAGGRTPSGGNATMNPRSDGLVVGNLQDPGNWSLEPDEGVRQRNVQAAIEFFDAMRAPSPGARFPRAEPPSVAPTVETFFDSDS